MKLKKGVQIFIILFILSITLIIAQDSEQTDIDKAYSCLEDELGDNCGNTRSTKQAAFNLLAVGYKSDLQADCKQSLDTLKKDNCWGETDTGTCNIKSTALATLALQHIDDNVDDHIDWLLDRKKTNTGLTWFLEIDSNNGTDCDINGKTITIEENKKISGSPPAGLVKAYNDYWFQINDIEKNYSISCNEDFITALIYQKPGSNVFHISSETNTASEFDTITERVNSYCLSTSSSCDYEGTLWAAIALAKDGKDIAPLIPYLTSMSDKAENKKYLPSAFLYILTNSDDYYSELISLQKSNNYWDESRNKFYDTALSLLALQNVNSDEVERAKKYLLNVQKNSGCWQSDTAFILHAAWPKNPTLSGGGSGISYCEDFSNFCVPIGDCDLVNTLDNFYCPSSAQVCCQERELDPTCSEKFGIVCNLDQECIGDSVTSLDSNYCCIGDCVEIITINECEEFGFFCKESCSKNQEEKAGYSNACNFGDICCGTKPQEEGGNTLLIVLLIILIILVILAIIFRNRLKVWFLKRKSGKSKSSSRPGPPGAFLPQRIMPRFPQPRRQAPGGRRAPANRDRDFEETMKKLKDMSK